MTVEHQNDLDAVLGPPARVKALRVSNYRSLGDDIEVRFGDLTVFVGPNGSGKSNVLDVFRFFREALTYGLEPAIAARLGITRLRRAAPTKPRAIKLGISLSSSDWNASYEIQINASKGASYKVEREDLEVHTYEAQALRLLVVGGKVREAPIGLLPRATDRELVLPSLAGDSQIGPVVAALRAIRMHSIFPRELSLPQQVGLTPPLDDSGSNWCAVLRTMGDDSMRDLRLGMERVTGDIVGIRVDSAGGYYTAEFEHQLDNARRWFSAGQESDGTLRLAGILTALLQRPAPPLIGIEEPELTINPGLLPVLYDYIKATSKRTQVVLTTHSPDLLDMLDMSDVRVVRRMRGVSSVERVSEAQLAMVRQDLLSPGALLRAGGFRGEGQEQDLFEMFEGE